MPTPKTLPDLLARLDDYTEESDGYLAVCPGHDDSKPSLRVAVGRNGKVLLKCRAGCTTDHVLDSLGMTMEDLTAIDTDNAPVPAARSTSAQATPGAIAGLAMRLDGYEQALAAMGYDRTNPAAEYAEQRFGLGALDQQRLGLGYTDDLGGNVPRLVVPFRTPQGVARNFQARALDPQAKVRWQGPKSPDGGSWSPIGWFPGESGWSEVLICEGPGDALTGAAVGYDTLGVAGAARVNNPAIVDEIAEWVTGRPVVIAGDGDPAGRQFSSTLARGLTAHGVNVRVLNLPDGVDLNDWRQKDPATFQTDLIRAIENAEHVTTVKALAAKWDESKYSLTDLGTARFTRDYAAANGSGIRYNAETGFYVLEDGIWRRDTSQRVRTMAQSVADMLRQLAADTRKEAAKDGADEYVKGLAKRLGQHAVYVQSSRGIDALLRELQAVEGVPVRLEAFDRDHHLLAFKNGVVDLRSGTMQPHDPNLLITRRIEFNYVPTATAPRWEQFVREVFPGKPEMGDFMQRLMGYGITGETGEQCFVVHWGKGSNGKSVWTELYTDVFRDITVTTPFSTFEQKPSGGIPNDLAALNGARLVFASEGEAGKFMNEALIKRVTGRDMISARFMRREFFEFRPQFLLSMLTNAKPTFRGQDEGLWRRVKLVSWDRHFAPDERDPYLHQKLLAEAEGIIAWTVRGAVDWYARGLDDPQIIKDATSEYRATSDVLEGFLPGVYEHEETGKVEATVAFKAFQEWADENNLLDLKRWSSRAFYGALEERQVVRKRSTGGKFYLFGIRRQRPTETRPDWSSAPEEVTKPLIGGGGALEGADLDEV